MENQEYKVKLKPFEIVCYSVSTLLCVWGLVYFGLGIASYFTIHQSNFYYACLKFKSLFGLSFLGWGLIIFGIGIFICSLTLILCAKNADREFEKRQRRAARLADRKNVEVVDAKVE